MTSPDLAETVGRFWVAPVPLPPRPPALVTDVDLVLRQLPAPDPVLGGAELTERLRPSTPPSAQTLEHSAVRSPSFLGDLTGQHGS